LFDRVDVHRVLNPVFRDDDAERVDWLPDLLGKVSNAGLAEYVAAKTKTTRPEESTAAHELAEALKLDRV
jgi:hypothetical protein